MENFLYGLSSIARGMQHSIFAMFEHQLVWGFALGFAASTIIHILVTSDQPRHIPHMLTKDKFAAFGKISPKAPDGTFLMSYSKFEHEYHHIRALSYTVLMAFLVVMIIATVRY